MAPHLPSSTRLPHRSLTTKHRPSPRSRRRSSRPLSFLPSMLRNNTTSSKRRDTLPLVVYIIVNTGILIISVLSFLSWGLSPEVQGGDGDGVVGGGRVNYTDSFPALTALISILALFVGILHLLAQLYRWHTKRALIDVQVLTYAIITVVWVCAAVVGLTPLSEKHQPFIVVYLGRSAGVTWGMWAECLILSIMVVVAIALTAYLLLTPFMLPSSVLATTMQPRRGFSGPHNWRNSSLDPTPTQTNGAYASLDHDNENEGPSMSTYSHRYNNTNTITPSLTVTEPQPEDETGGYFGRTSYSHEGATTASAAPSRGRTRESDRDEAMIALTGPSASYPREDSPSYPRYYARDRDESPTTRGRRVDVRNWSGSYHDARSRSREEHSRRGSVAASELFLEMHEGVERSARGFV